MALRRLLLDAVVLHFISCLLNCGMITPYTMISHLLATSLATSKMAETETETTTGVVGSSPAVDEKRDRGDGEVDAGDTDISSQDSKPVRPMTGIKVCMLGWPLCLSRNSQACANLYSGLLLTRPSSCRFFCFPWILLS